MRPGYWLNPINGKLMRVSTHDIWIREKENADSIGLPPHVYEEITKLPPTAVDEVRIAAMKGGLVRIRQHRHYVSIQFMAQQQEVTPILRAVANALKSVGIHTDERLVIDNLLLMDRVEVSLGELGERVGEEGPSGTGE
jgi:hypothetical protein